MSKYTPHNEVALKRGTDEAMRTMAELL
jgi:hypothetical protein